MSRLEKLFGDLQAAVADLKQRRPDLSPEELFNTVTSEWNKTSRPYQKKVLRRAAKRLKRDQVRQPIGDFGTQILVLRNLLDTAREDLKEQTAWADEYHETAEQLHAQVKALQEGVSELLTIQNLLCAAEGDDLVATIKHIIQQRDDFAAKLERKNKKGERQ